MSAPLSETGDALDSHLRETQVDSTALFQGAFLHALRDTVRLPDGSTPSASICCTLAR